MLQKKYAVELEMMNRDRERAYDNARRHDAAAAQEALADNAEVARLKAENAQLRKMLEVARNGARRDEAVMTYE